MHPTSSPDFLLLDVTGIDVLFGGEEQLAREVAAELASLGYDARVAVAGTIGAAWGMAREQKGVGSRESGVGGAEQSCISSTEYSVPSTAYSAGDATPDSRLPTPDSLPVAALRLPQDTIDLLAQLGIHRLDQLLALPRRSLRSRFGERLLLKLDQFLGTAPETIVPHRPPPRFVAERVLEYPLERREAVEPIVRELVEQVARELAERREGAVQLAGRLDCAPGRVVWLEVGLFRPSAEPAHLWDLVRMRLEQTSLPGPLGRATLAATLTAPLENRQGELFAGGEHEAARHLALLIDRCRSRLGAEAVVQPELAADPLPERGFRAAGSGFRRGQRSEVRGQKKGSRGSGVGGRGPGSRRARSSDSRLPTSDSRLPASPLARPIVLLAVPLALDVVSIVPDGPPRAFRWQGHTHRVVRWWGPERIETGWWRGRSVRRDYWRVETDAGCRFWLFRRLDDGQWHLHGHFG